MITLLPRITTPGLSPGACSARNRTPIRARSLGRDVAKVRSHTPTAAPSNTQPIRRRDGKSLLVASGTSREDIDSRGSAGGWDICAATLLLDMKQEFQDCQMRLNR